MQNTPFRCGPVALTNAAANILNPGTTTGGVNATGSPYGSTYIIMTKIHVADKSGSGGTFTLYIGATGGSAAGTELCKTVSVPANGYVDIPCRTRLDVADFLTGLASANTTLTIEIDGEIGICK